MRKMNVISKEHQKIINEYRDNGLQIDSFGEYDHRDFMEIQLNLSIKEYADEIIIYFEKEDKDYRRMWVDVEGMGYGWLWLQQPDNESKWFSLIAKEIVREAKNLLEEKNTLIVKIIDTETDTITYYIHYLDSYQRKDYIFRISNTELSY